MALYIIKIGGSIATNKKRALSFRKNAVIKIGKELAKLMNERKYFILVHGGGSFGHYYAKKYNIYQKLKKYNIEGISKTKLAMRKLNYLICKEFIKQNLNPYPIEPQTIIENSTKFLKRIIKDGFVPITYGDIIVQNNKYRIISGDELVKILTEKLKTKKVIFLSDVNGLLDEKGKVIKNLHSVSFLKNVIFKESKDATGEMKNKIKEALQIAKSFCPVYITNGNKPENISKIIKGKKCVCTKIY